MPDTLLDLPEVVTLLPGEHVLETVLAGFPGFSSGRPQGTLYLEPGAHHFPGRVVFPKGIELYLPPGAELELLGGDSVTILGPLQAGLTRIFALRASPRPAVILGTLEAGSSHITEVYPEWFGAGPAPTSAQPTGLVRRDDNRALEAAVDTAWRQRVLAGLPPLPVLLTGAYGLSGTLSLRAQGDTGGAVISEGLLLRGHHGGSPGASGQAGTFQCLPGFTDRAMVLLEDLKGATLEGLAFDAVGRAETCVEVAPQSLRATPQEPTDILFRSCLFTGATDRQVGVLSRVGPALEVGRPAPGSAGVISFDGCQIEVPSRSLPTLEPAAGIEVEGLLPYLVRVVHGVLEGDARWLVGAAGGALLLKGCQFANRRRGSTERWDLGLDVLLVAVEGARQTAPPLTMVHCRSVSDRFLAVLPFRRLRASPFPFTEGLVNLRPQVLSDSLVSGADSFGVTLLHVEHDPARPPSPSSSEIPVSFGVKVEFSRSLVPDFRMTLAGSRFRSAFVLSREVCVYLVDAENSLAGLVPAAQLSSIR